jgi:hypothetical protein
MNSLINRAAIKKLALGTAEKRAHKFTRVSAQFLDDIEAQVRSLVTRKVHAHPSKGQTLT